MTDASIVKLIIILNERDEERLDQVTRNLLREMKDLDEVNQVGLVAVEEMPEGAKAFGGCLLGILTAEVSVKNFQAVMGFLWERLAGKSIELEVEANGKKLKVKAGSQQELLAVIRAAEQFVAAV